MAGMQIAPGIGAAEWKNLDLDDPNSWPRAIEIFAARIRGRFMEAADHLIADDETRQPMERRWGFAILAIDCLLIETLEAFRQGFTDTRRKSKDLSVDFLTSRPSFRTVFSKELAERFYYEFRCGIAHNAQVFGSGRIWSIGPLLDVNGGDITVNRTEFHKGVRAELDAYIAELQKYDEVELRTNFRNKMDFIADGKLQQDSA